MPCTYAVANKAIFGSEASVIICMAAESCVIKAWAKLLGITTSARISPLTKASCASLRLLYRMTFIYFEPSKDAAISLICWCSPSITSPVSMVLLSRLMAVAKIVIRINGRMKAVRILLGSRMICKNSLYIRAFKILIYRSFYCILQSGG